MLFSIRQFGITGHMFAKAGESLSKETNRFMMRKESLRPKLCSEKRCNLHGRGFRIIEIRRHFLEPNGKIEELIFSVSS